jgi:hypothetical protein
MAKRRLTFRQFNLNIPESLQNDFINLTLADLNSKRSALISGTGLTFSLRHPEQYLVYLRTLYNPVINVAIASLERHNSEVLTFRQVSARNFLSIVWSTLETSPIPDRIDSDPSDPLEVLLVKNSILFNTTMQKHPADPRLS